MCQQEARTPTPRTSESELRHHTSALNRYGEGGERGAVISCMAIVCMALDARTPTMPVAEGVCFHFTDHRQVLFAPIAAEPREVFKVQHKAWDSSCYIYIRL